MNIVACVVAAALAQVSEKLPVPQHVQQIKDFIQEGQAAREGRHREMAVAKGLRWLFAHQQFDGGWSFTTDSASPSKVANPGQAKSRMAATSLALFAFMGAGNTPVKGRHRSCVSEGVEFLASELRLDGERVDAQGVDGDLWSHALATLVLCQLHDMTKDSKYREPARGAAAQLLAMQGQRTGGWRRTDELPPDLETTAWAVFALHSAQLTRVIKPEDSFQLANRFLDAQREPETGYFRHADGKHSPCATSLGLAARCYTQGPGDKTQLRKSIDYVLENRADPHDALYDFATTTAMHALEGDDWKVWNDAFRDRLIRTQEADGSWHDPQDRASAAYGRLYETALRMLALEAYYRHLPMFAKILFAP